MESLALLAALIVSIAFIGGPLSFLLSFLKNLTGKLEIGRIFFLFLFGIPALLVGTYLVTQRISPGATFMGLIGISSSSLAMYRVIKQIQKKNKVH